MPREFLVSVSMRKFTSWRRHPWFPTMGGLLGLGLGAYRKRELTIKVRISRELADDYGRRRRLEEFLEKNGFQSRWDSRVRMKWIGTYYVLEDLYEFNREPTKDEIKEACRRLKKYWTEEIASIISADAKH